MKKKIVLKSWVIYSLIILGSLGFGIFLALLFVGIFNLPSLSILLSSGYLLGRYGC